jgi:predicted ATPase
MFLTQLTRKPGLRLPRHFPFTLPLVKNLKTLKFPSPVTFFTGENGSGKSTLLEALAAALNLPTLGSHDIARDESLGAARALAVTWRLSKTKAPKHGFFFRAEDYFGYVRRLSREMNELRKTEEEFEGKFKGYAKTLATGSVRGQRSALEGRYGANPDGRSHGEGFLHMLQERLRPDGLYLMDEPETPLSPLRQMALLSILKEMVEKNCQFVIATHSPILMAYPDAEILDFNSGAPKAIGYEEAEQVQLTRSFLQDPEGYVNKLLT